MIAIAESTPGPAAVNSATYLGYRVGGFPGAFLGTLAVCIPSFIIIYAISLFFDAFLSIKYVGYAFRGVQACVIYLPVSYTHLDVYKRQLKGNDGVTVSSGDITLISRLGDGIKTSDTSLSKKGKQKGSVTIESGIVNIYAACDGIDAACDVVIADGTLNIYTDKYSDYSEEVTAVAGNTYYIRSASADYSFSVHYYNSDGEGVWVNTDGKYEKVGSGRQSYCYYTVERAEGYDYMDVYAYTCLLYTSR